MPALLALFIAAFAFGTTEFVIAGVLPQVAAGLDVSIPTAGTLVSAYAVGIAIGGPLLTLATARSSRRSLLIALAAIFTIGQAACALASDFTSMLLLRISVSVAHGAFFGVAMVVATGLVGPGQRGRAVAIVLAGLTVSNVLGVPAGAAIGTALGWRWTFWAMFVLGIVSLAAMAALLPRVLGSGARPAGFLRQARVLGRQQVWTSLIVMLLLMLAQFVPFTFIAPLLQEVTGLAPDLVPWVMLLNGAGATLGVFAGGRLADWKLTPALIVLTATQAVVMSAMYLAAPHPWPMAAVVGLWACINFAIGGLAQTRILAWTADAPNLASSLIPSGFNVGIALAASVGALLLDAGYGYRALPLLGIAAMTLAAVTAALSHASELRRGTKAPQAVLRS